ncbi:MAG: alkylhydroperoxidase like protein AhpD family [Acidimicrobiales bacterium]|nr:alkylhydroperoxidase like protein AhpD family [Acidimicrobiales bacterium]
MDSRDPFPRRTATPGRLLPWFAELGKNLPGLVRSYLPGQAIDSRTRERVILAVTEVNGCRYCAWIHGSWQDFLGENALVDADEALLTYARACAEAGRPLDTAPLAGVLPPESLGAVRATVAQIEVSNLVGNTVDGLLARLTRKRPLDPLRTAEELAVVAAAIPLAVPMLAAGAALRAASRLAPPVPDADMPAPGEANLLVHLLAQLAPTLLANSLLRLAVLGSPVVLPVGLKAGRTTATVRVGRGRLALENGISPDVVMVIEGDVEPLLRLASGAVLQEARNLRIRRP